MKVDCSLFLTEFGPRKGRKAEVDESRIELIKLPLEREPVPRGDELTPVQRPRKECLIQVEGVK
jgi:hypothetical protein